MSFGKTISNIRKSKHLSIDQVTSSTITKSSYSRFIEGKTQPSVNNFLTILDNLHVNFEEFLFIERGFCPNFFNKVNTEIHLASIKQDIHKLEDLKHTLQVYHQEDPNTTEYYHLECVVTLILNNLKGQEYDPTSKKVIYNYLMSCDLWTHYEHTLFKNTIFIFNVDTVKAMEKSIIKNLDNYQLFHEYGNESFRTMAIMLGFYIHNKDLMAAIRIITKLTNVHLEPSMVFEKNVYQLCTGIVFMLSNQKNGFEKIKTALKVFEFTDAKEYLYASITYLKQISNIYNFHHPKLDKIFNDFTCK